MHPPRDRVGRRRPSNLREPLRLSEHSFPLSGKPGLSSRISRPPRGFARPPRRHSMVKSPSSRSCVDSPEDFPPRPVPSPAVRSPRSSPSACPPRHAPIDKVLPQAGKDPGCSLTTFATGFARSSSVGPLVDAPGAMAKSVALRRGLQTYQTDSMRAAGGAGASTQVGRPRRRTGVAAVAWLRRAA